MINATMRICPSDVSSDDIYFHIEALIMEDVFSEVMFLDSQMLEVAGIKASFPPILLTSDDANRANDCFTGALPYVMRHAL